MLPNERFGLDTRHRTDDSKTTSDFKKANLPSNIILPYDAAFYITDITVPVSWYTVEAGRIDIIQISESMGLVMPLLNALSPKETITQLHLRLLCVNL